MVLSLSDEVTRHFLCLHLIVKHLAPVSLVYSHQQVWFQLYWKWV